MEEKYKLVGLVLFFLGIFFMPAGSETFKQAVLGGVYMLNDYAQKHVLTCLVPAFFIAGGIAVFVRKEVVLKYLGGKANQALAYTIASVSGAVLAVCSCTVMPIFAGIYKRGAGLGPATAFLYSGPAINVAAIFLTWGVFGWKMGLARAIAAILLSILIGLSMAAIFRGEKSEGNLLSGEGGFELSKTTTSIFFGSMVLILVVNGLQMDKALKYILMFLLALVTAVTVKTKFKAEERNEWFSQVWDFTKTMTPYLFIGVFIAGFLDPYLPRELVERLVGQNNLLGNLAASIFGAFMYFSTLTEVPIIQMFMSKGMQQGPALALFLSGPSLSLPSMLMIKSVLGTKKTVVYTLLVIGYSTIAGLIFGGM